MILKLCIFASVLVLAVSQSPCVVCGEGKVVTNPDIIWMIPGQPAVQCGLLETVGLQGLIPDGLCDPLPALISADCGCEPAATPVAPTDAPVAPINPTDVPVAPTDAPVDGSPTSPTFPPTPLPTFPPTPDPTPDPTPHPTSAPSANPTSTPTSKPIAITPEPTPVPTPDPTPDPTPSPTEKTKSPTSNPTSSPTRNPTPRPSPAPTKSPTPKPSPAPTPVPTRSLHPSASPSAMPTTLTCVDEHCACRADNECPKAFADKYKFHSYVNIGEQYICFGSETHEPELVGPDIVFRPHSAASSDEDDLDAFDIETKNLECCKEVRTCTIPDESSSSTKATTSSASSDIRMISLMHIVTLVVSTMILLLQAAL